MKPPILSIDPEALSMSLLQERIEERLTRGGYLQKLTTNILQLNSCYSTEQFHLRAKKGKSPLYFLSVKLLKVSSVLLTVREYEEHDGAFQLLLHVTQGNGDWNVWK